jgi:hypothetical protein
MTRWVRKPAVHVALVVVLAVTAGTAATLLAADRSAPAAVSPEAVPVTETVVACPGLRSREGFTESTVAAATPPRVPGVDPNAPGAGVVRTLSPHEAHEKTLIKLKQPGDRGSYVGRNGERDSVTGQAHGSLAPGFSVTQTERTVDGKGRGLAATQCQPTSTDFWFVGAASDVGNRAVLVLTNPESADATVDVTFHGKSGLIDAPGARGIQVPARSSVDVRLDEKAPGEKVLGVHVQVRVGRLSAAITETDVFGFEPRGTDWLPAAQAPSTSMVVPGIPAVHGGRESDVVLDIVAPGEAAVAALTIVTPEGTFAPKGADVVDVPAGGVASVDLTKALRGEAAAVLISSDTPVTAGARVVLRDPKIFGDTLFLAAAPPLNQTAVVPDNRATKDLATRLILTAPTQGAGAVVTGFAGGQDWTAGRIRLDTGTTGVLTVRPPPAKLSKGSHNIESFGLVVTPTGDGQLYGVRMLDEQGPRGPLVTSFPLRTARLQAKVRESYPDIAVGTVP